MFSEVNNARARRDIIRKKALKDARDKLIPLANLEYVASGLNQHQVEQRQVLKLTNTQNFESSRKFREILRSNLLTLFNGIVGGCFLLLLLIGEWKDALFGLAVIANVLIGVGQEYRSKRTLDRLAVMNAPSATVLRESQVKSIKVSDVVLDDLLVLAPGDQLVADAELLEAQMLQVDESLLTGEINPILKKPSEQLLAGSVVLAGEGKARVVKVGPETYASRISFEARRFSLVKSELRAALNRIILWLSIGLAPLVAIVVNGQVGAVGGWQNLADREAAVEVIVSSTASIVSMIPQGLVLITSLAFALAAIRLSRMNVLVQELPAVENLARVNVICFDKTGTLTKGEMSFASAVELEVSDQPMLDWKNVLGHFGADPKANATARCLRGHFEVTSPLVVTQAVPFSSDQKWSGYEFRINKELEEIWVLAAPELLVSQQKDPETWRKITDFQDLGQRVLVLATGSGRIQVGLPEKLQARVLLVISEEIRKDFTTTLEYFKEQGVSVRILSGDSPKTVAAVARRAGIDFPKKSGTLEAVDARSLPQDRSSLAKVMKENYLFGRVSPEQKRDMVLALQSLGLVVAMTGDGVNDALSLKQADLGIAMGSGSPATKAVARLVLLDGKFSSLPGVVAEGRRVIANIERISRLFLSKTTWAILLAIIFGLLSWKFPYLPRQLSALDGFTIGLPAIALALLPNSQRYLPGFLQRTLAFAIPSGLIVALAVISTSLYINFLDSVSMQEAQTGVSLVLSITGLWVLVTISRPLDISKILIISACYVVFGAVYLVPQVAEFFGFTWLGFEKMIVPIVISLLACALIDLVSRWDKNNQRFRSAKTTIAS